MPDQCQSSNLNEQHHCFVCILLWVALAIYMAGIWVLSSLGPAVTRYVDAIGIPDFFWHLGLYGGLCLLAIKTFGPACPTQQTWLPSLKGAAVALGYSILDEIHQNFVPGRGTEAQDIAGNLAGVVLAVALVILWQTLMTRHR